MPKAISKWGRGVRNLVLVKPSCLNETHEVLFQPSFKQNSCNNWF